MNKKYLLIGVLIITGLGMAGYILNKTTHHGVAITENIENADNPEKQHEGFSKKAGKSAKKYIEGIPDGLVLMDETDPNTKIIIENWEERILNYAESIDIDISEREHLQRLANKTASLVKLLKEASDREKDGLEPYTPISSLNTMTLIMSMENEFKEYLGISFSDFFASRIGNRFF